MGEVHTIKVLCFCFIVWKDYNSKKLVYMALIQCNIRSSFNHQFSSRAPFSMLWTLSFNDTYMTCEVFYRSTISLNYIFARPIKLLMFYISKLYLRKQTLIFAVKSTISYVYIAYLMYCFVAVRFSDLSVEARENVFYQSYGILPKFLPIHKLYPKLVSKQLLCDSFLCADIQACNVNYKSVVSPWQYERWDRYWC